MGLFSSKNKSETTKTGPEASSPEATPAAMPETGSEPVAQSASPSVSDTQQAAATPAPSAAETPPQAVDDRPDLSPEEARNQAAIGKKLAAAFGELVTLLMRSEVDRKRPIADLEWMIAPAIATGQFAIADAQSKKTGAISPIGAVLWAMVSKDVDKRLSDTSTEQAQLKPDEWRSGAEPWIVLAIGDKRIVAGLIKQLSQEVFKDQAPKIRSRNTDGKIVIGRVQATEEPNASS